MLLNAIEKALMNNPVRAAIQRHVEVPRLLSLGGPMRKGHALEIGCGRGVGAALILDRFGAERVDAFDLDPGMVALARERLARHGDRVRLWVGDAERIEADSGTYDAVFDFGAIHHVPRWQIVLGEVARVLKPGGRFYAEEVLVRFILHPLWRRIFEHPLQDRFDRLSFAEGLRSAGLEVVDSAEMLDWFAWYVADKPST